MTTLKAKDDEITSAIRHHWDRRAATFDNEPCHGLHSPAQREAWLEVLGKLAGASPLSVLDIGCGTGFLALLLAELGHSVTGIDMAPQMLNAARQKAEQLHLSVRLRLENAASVQDRDGTYDLVIARHVIWVLPDPARGVREWLRLLRPGGRLALIEGKWGPDEIKITYRDSINNALAAVLSAVSKVIRYPVAKTKRWAFLVGKLNNWRYRQIQAQLPFSGGPSAEQLLEFLETQGLRDLTVESLMRPVLWGKGSQYPRYLVVGRRERY
jgi:2-polyprenyl-3-methyl-5-hydroxy-6-metoxy-1,4-benzoquinol methylase